MTLRDTKAALSLVAVLCNDEHIQRVLPQFILGNENILPEGLCQVLLAERYLMPNVYLMRAKSAWTNDETLAHIVRK